MLVVVVNAVVLMCCHLVDSMPEDMIRVEEEELGSLNEELASMPSSTKRTHTNPEAVLLLPQPWLRSPGVDYRRHNTDPSKSSLHQILETSSSASSAAETSMSPTVHPGPALRQAPESELPSEVASSGQGTGHGGDSGMCQEVCHVCRQVRIIVIITS